MFVSSHYNRTVTSDPCTATNMQNTTFLSFFLSIAKWQLSSAGGTSVMLYGKFINPVTSSIQGTIQLG